jgi:hypothetical protein
LPRSCLSDFVPPAPTPMPATITGLSFFPPVFPVPVAGPLVPECRSRMLLLICLSGTLSDVKKPAWEAIPSGRFVNRTGRFPVAYSFEFTDKSGLLLINQETCIMI